MRDKIQIFFMDICDRINQIIEREGLSVASFARRIGAGDQTVRGIVAQRRNKPGYDLILKIAQTFEWLNINWLITGEGEMVDKKAEPNMANQTNECISNDSMLEFINYLREKDIKIEQLIEEKSMWKHKYLTLHEKESLRHSETN